MSHAGLSHAGLVLGRGLARAERHRPLQAALVMLMGLSWIAVAEEVRACSCISPSPVTEVVLGDGRIAANTRGVSWSENVLSGSVREFAFERWNGSAFEPAAAIVELDSSTGLSVLGPESAWTVGERYRITTLGAREPWSGPLPGAVLEARGPESVEIDIVEPLGVDVPFELTAVGSPLRGPVQVPMGSSCSTVVEGVYVEVAWRQPPPGHEALHLVTKVDERTYQRSQSVCDFPRVGVSSLGLRGRERIVAACGGKPSSASGVLQEGSHGVVMEATLPGTGVVWRSSELRLELDCGRAALDPNPAVVQGLPVPSPPSVISQAMGATENGEILEPAEPGATGEAQADQGATATQEAEEATEPEEAIGWVERDGCSVGSARLAGEGSVAAKGFGAATVLLALTLVRRRR